MKPLTRPERAAIYRQAAEKVLRHIQKGYLSRCCVFLGDMLSDKFSGTSPKVLRETFSEFYLFEHSQIESNGWWEDDIDGDNCRILALLLSAEITLKP